ncbi:DNA polymerase III subunit delta [Ruminococcaceae bacterium OttesenSCG-928-I18]|nr:DNA polymerase III subunit delta [Ruminococcaceae bacterium OttesenSCG-928-I18]
MTSSFKQLNARWAELQNASVLYFSALDANLLREAEKHVVSRWRQEGGEEPTRLDGPVPDFGEVIAATGAISLFGGSRHVILREIVPASMGDKDVKELADLFSELENAVLLVTALYKDKRAMTSKKAKMLSEAAAQNGFAAELKPHSKTEVLEMVQQVAEGLGTAFAPGAAEELLERAGADLHLLEKETEKLAAISGYGRIDSELVRRYGVRNVEADVFELVRLITAGRKAPAQEKLSELLALRHEPIAITGALGGSFVDMLRVRTGAESRHSVSQVFLDMHYKGSEYRLTKAEENARRYATAALEQGVLLLAELDGALKSNPLTDKAILLQAAVARLIQLRGSV